MDMRKIVGLVIIAFVLLLIAVGISAMGEVSIESPNNDIPEGAVEVFTTKTRNKVIAELGQPIEGFEPFMFLEVYPGLEESDFDGVDAFIGVYRFKNGELTHEMDNTQPFHSAATAISDEGMATLLDNVSSRLGISIETGSDVAEIIEAIEKSDDEGVQSDQRVNVIGEVVCLPHKDREGPQTLECALGLLAYSGNYYGFTIFHEILPDILQETGNRVRVTGINKSPWSQNIYDIVGVIDIESVEEL
jgi:hypothetical protein